MHFYPFQAPLEPWSALEPTAAIKAECIQVCSIDELRVCELKRLSVQDDFFQLLLIAFLRIIDALKVFFVLCVKSLIHAILECELLVAADADIDEGVDEAKHATDHGERRVKRLDRILCACLSVTLDQIEREVSIILAI